MALAWAGGVCWAAVWGPCGWGGHVWGGGGEAVPAVLSRGRWPVPGAYVAGTKGGRGILVLKHAYTRHCYYTTHQRVVPGPCRGGLRTEHPARG